MRRSAMMLGVAMVLCGCQVVPNTNQATNPTLKFKLNFQEPDFLSPSIEMETTTSVDAGKCVFVSVPFGVTATASDKGGLAFMAIGPSAFFDALQVRQLDGDIFALPSPSVATQVAWNDTFANPGNRPASSIVQVNYQDGKAFSDVTLHGTYFFSAGADIGALRATVRNFGSQAGVSEVFNFYVRPASNKAAEQPGMSCPTP